MCFDHIQPLAQLLLNISTNFCSLSFLLIHKFKFVTLIHSWMYGLPSEHGHFNSINILNPVSVCLFVGVGGYVCVLRE